MNSYKISVKEWVEKTNAIGITAKAGRYGGTYAHKDIAFEFGMWISPRFKLYLIKEFERLKEEEYSKIYTYACEADVLNVALFGLTASEWKKQNPELKGNIRDYADASQLVCLSNLESINAMLINDGISMETRIEKLNEIAIYQMNILLSDTRVNDIEEKILAQENN